MPSTCARTSPFASSNWRRTRSTRSRSSSARERNQTMIRLQSLAIALLLTASSAGARAEEPANAVLRPRVLGTLRLHARERRETAPMSGEFESVERDLDWQADETAIIVCDMW